MRQLLACAACRRQYDVSEMRVGSRFRCRCGEVLRVPAIQAKDAAVVRCGSCGGPREKGARACRFCSADFTLHEQDLQTICAVCLTRISDRARYCHHCATPIAPEESGGDLSDKSCPACEDDQRLRSRNVGRGANVSLLECTRCAGMWLGQDAFRAVVERARGGDALEPHRPGRGEAASRGGSGQRGPLYRRCPVCSVRMHRRNYGRRSGIVVDTCADHGIWFDCEELDGILRWIREGGERVAREREQDEKRRAAMRERFKVAPKSPEDSWSLQGSRRRGRNDLLGELIGALFDV